MRRVFILPIEHAVLIAGSSVSPVLYQRLQFGSVGIDRDEPRNGDGLRAEEFDAAQAAQQPLRGLERTPRDLEVVLRGGEDGFHRAIFQIEHDESPLVAGARGVGDAIAVGRNGNSAEIAVGGESVD